MPDFAHDGVLVIDRVLDDTTVTLISKACEPLLRAGPSDSRRPGVRRVFAQAFAARELVATSPIPELVESLCNAGATVVRTILFDKSPEANWLVPWHQDATIAVRERIDVEGFGPWSLKDGEPHCRPPRAILDSILVVRVHLDDCGPKNGPLRVIPGSHRRGLLSSDEVDRAAVSGPVLECCTPAGGAVVMRPHTVHSSPRAVSPTRRRVLHLEFCPLQLPGGLRWAEGDVLDASRTVP